MFTDTYLIHSPLRLLPRPLTTTTQRKTGLRELAPSLVALNSSDACTASVESLQAFMVDAANQLGLEVLRPIVDELSRIGKSYFNLRRSLAISLYDDHLSTPVVNLMKGFSRRSFEITSTDFVEATSDKPKLTGGAAVQNKAKGRGNSPPNSNPRRSPPNSGGLLGSLMETVAPTNLSVLGDEEPATPPTAEMSLAHQCRLHILHCRAFTRAQPRLTPAALGCLLDILTEALSDQICGLLLTGLRVNEWGALLLQREVRDLERLLSAYLVGSPHSLNPKFARLEQALLLLNLVRPGAAPLSSNITLCTLRRTHPTHTTPPHHHRSDQRRYRCTVSTSPLWTQMK